MVHSLRPQRTGGGSSKPVLRRGMGLATTVGKACRPGCPALVAVGTLSMMMPGCELRSKMALIDSDATDPGLPSVGISGAEPK